MSESVKVVVRVRPMNKRERDLNAKKVLSISTETSDASIVHPNEPDNIKRFTFDGSYDENTA
jgi:kinesin family member 17